MVTPAESLLHFHAVASAHFHESFLAKRSTATAAVRLVVAQHAGGSMSGGAVSSATAIEMQTKVIALLQIAIRAFDQRFFRGAFVGQDFF